MSINSNANKILRIFLIKIQCMKVIVYFIIFIAIVCGCSSSHKPSEDNSISEWNVIAKKVMHPDSLIECDLNLVNQKTVFPLSNLVTEFKLIKLDNATKERMISVNDKICLSTNYIIVYGSGSQTTKLFDAKGNFIAIVGNIGDGPGEYAPWAETVQIDENNKRIYQTTIANQECINVYSLEDGCFIKKIPLVEKGNRARMFVDTQRERVSVLQVPMPHANYIIWEQDFSNHVMSGVAASQYQDANYTNSAYGWNSGCIEPVLNELTGKISASFIHYFPTKDSLYHFENHKLTPYFTVNYINNNIPYHTIDELNRYYLITLYINDGSVFKKLDKRIIVDKETLKGCETSLLLDELGNIPIDFIPTFQNGFFYYNISPEELEKKIRVALQSSDITKKNKEKLMRVLNEIGPDDNNYIMIGALK